MPKSEKPLPPRHRTFSERLMQFQADNHLTTSQLRELFGFINVQAVRGLLLDARRRPPTAPTLMLLEFFERHPQFVPPPPPVLSAEEVLNLFQAHFPVRSWELSLIFGRASSSSYRWLSGSQTQRSYVLQISALFARQRALGVPDEQIVRLWLPIVRDHLRDKPNKTRYERVFFERLEKWSSEQSREPDREPHPASSTP